MCCLKDKDRCDTVSRCRFFVTPLVVKRLFLSQSWVYAAVFILHLVKFNPAHTALTPTPTQSLVGFSDFVLPCSGFR